jgi:hypothetical protein
LSGRRSFRERDFTALRRITVTVGAISNGRPYRDSNHIDWKPA